MPFHGIYPFQLFAKEKNTKKDIHKFKKNIKVEVTYNEKELAGIDPSALSLYWHDEEYGIWKPIPVDLDREDSTLTAEFDYFTDIALGENSWDNHKIPDLDAAQTDLFTGSASYSIPISVPTGPGGIGSPVSLSYNSMSAEGVYTSQYVYDTLDEQDSSQISIVGLGWNLSAGGSIERNMGKDLVKTEDDTFSISVGGVSFSLVPVSVKNSDATYKYIQYKASDENFWLIRRYTKQDAGRYLDANGFVCTPGSSGCNYINNTTESDYWVVWDKAGNIYWFEDRAYYFEYTTSSRNYRPWRWNLSKTTFSSGMSITYQYFKEPDRKNFGSGGTIQMWVDTASYLSIIQYPDSGTKVTFLYQDRPDRMWYWGDGGHHFRYDKQRLNSIVVYSNNQIKREYRLQYLVRVDTNNNVWPQESVLPGVRYTHDVIYSNTVSYPTDPNSPKNRNTVSVLEKVIEYGAGGCTPVNNSCTGQALPATQFTYGTPWQMFLTKIDNGYGGSVQFEYETVDTVNASKPFTAQIGMNNDPFTLRSSSQWLSGGQTERLLTPDLNYNTPRTMNVRPGLGYRLKCNYSVRTDGGDITVIRFAMYYSGTNNTGGSTTSWQLGFAKGTSGEASANLVIPADATKAAPAVRWEAGSTIDISNCKLDYVTTHYRVTKRTLSDATTLQNYVYTYSYTIPGTTTDSQAVNDPAHSQFATNYVANPTNYPLSTKAYSEIRGNAVVSVTNPDLTISRTYFKQDDDLKGKATDVFLIDNAQSNKVISYVHYEYGKAGSIENYTPYSIPENNSAFPCPSKVSTSTPYLCFKDFDVNWIYLKSEASYQYPNKSYAPSGNDLLPNYTQNQYETYVGTNFVGTKTEYKYDNSDQLNMANGFQTSQWGNTTRTIESLWTGSWTSSRATRMKYAGFNNGDDGDPSVINPNPYLVKHLTELVVFNLTYSCPDNTCNYSLANLKAGSCNIYANPIDGGSGFYCSIESEGISGSPQTPLITGKRTIISTSTLQYIDEQYRYDNWGNQIKTIVYTGYGSSSSIAIDNPHITESCYGASPIIEGGQTTSCTDDGVHAFLAWTKNANSQIAQYKYDRQKGTLIEVKDPNNQSTTATYDEFGRMTSATKPVEDAGATTVSAVYSDTLNPAQVTPFYVTISQRIDSSTTKVTRRYQDGFGRIVQTQIDSDLAIGTNKIVAVDTVYSTNDPALAAKTSSPYVIETPSNPTSKYCGSTGCTIRTDDGYNRVYTETTYDELGRPLTVIQMSGATISYSYTLADDSTKNLLTIITDAKLNVSKTYTDAWGRTIKARTPVDVNNIQLIDDTVFEYDIFGQLLKTTQGTTVLSEYAYDLAGRKLSILNDVDLGSWYYTYDAVGNLVRQKDQKGNRICFYYDVLNRLTAKHYRNDDTCPIAGTTFTKNVSFTYDEGLNGIGRRTSMTDNGSNITRWVFDERGRLKEERKGIGSDIFLTKWEYNSADLLRKMYYPAGANETDGEQVVYTYLKQGTIHTISNTDGVLYVASTDYDAMGRITDRNLNGNNNTTLYTRISYFPWTDSYKRGGRVLALLAGTTSSNSDWQSLSYSYDMNGNVTSIQNSLSGETETLGFSYDGLNRLTSFYNNGVLDTYSYESHTGRLLTKEGLTLNYVGTGPYHAVKSTSGNPTYTYGYDGNGNMISRTINSQTTTFNYDPENHLTSTSGTVITSFVYDGDGNRVKATAGGISTEYVGNYFEWSNSSMTKHYFAGTQRIATRTGPTYNNTSGLKFILFDHLGSPYKEIGPDNSASTPFKYRPWGGDRNQPSSNAVTTNTYSFTSQRGQDVLDLLFYNARWYDPVIGRFIQADSIIPSNQGVQAWDRYAYVSNNPVNGTDPTGHAKCAAGPKAMCMNDEAGSGESYLPGSYRQAGISPSYYLDGYRNRPNKPSPAPTSSPTPSSTASTWYSSSPSQTPTPTSALVPGSTPTPSYGIVPGPTPTPTPTPVPTLSPEQIEPYKNVAGYTMDVGEGLNLIHVPTFVGMFIDGWHQSEIDKNSSYTPNQKALRSLAVAFEGQAISYASIGAAGFGTTVTLASGLGAIAAGTTVYLGVNVILSKVADWGNSTIVFPLIDQHIR